jgi:outer membrane protein insertion porin family
MKKLFPKSLLAIVLCCSAGIRVSAQTRDTIAPAPDQQPAGLNLPLGNSQPQQYEIADITISGTQYLDKSLLVSLSGLNVGDKIVYPGGDQFAKAIQSLWGQRLFANVAIYVTKIEDGKIWLEIDLQERPRLNNFVFRGVKKSETEELIKKAALRKGSVVTESMKQNAIGVISKHYADKGFRNAVVTLPKEWILLR